MNKIMIAAVVAAVSGCAHSPQETCQGYGFSPGDDAFSQCVQLETIARRQEQQQAVTRMQNQANAYQQQLSRSPLSYTYQGNR